jgi:hypothetical protein
MAFVLQLSYFPRCARNIAIAAADGKGRAVIRRCDIMRFLRLGLGGGVEEYRRARDVLVKARWYNMSPQ